jgi:hypothetical protein
MVDRILDVLECPVWIVIHTWRLVCEVVVDLKFYFSLSMRGWRRKW